MNTGFYKDLDTNFQQALEMSEKEFSHEELINMLENGNIPEKQIAALKLETLNNEDEARILISNLTGCDGKIREAVALKINKILLENKDLMTLLHYPEVFADASIDINANICRLIIDSVSILKEMSSFSEIYLGKIFLYIKEAFAELDNFIFRDKKYVINKQLFKLYWSLEALKLFAKDLPLEILTPLLKRASQEREYTIREKVAQIAVLIDSIELEQLKEALKNDENYYVRNVFN